MTATMTRAEELRNDLGNLYFTQKYYIGMLAELEDLGQMGSPRYRSLEREVEILNHNIRRLNTELDKAEAEEYEKSQEELEDPRQFSTCTFW